MVTLLRQAGMAPAVAHRYVRVGTALDDIPSVASYAVDGALSGEHMDSIVKGLNHIARRNPDLPEDDRTDCVRGLLAEALTATPSSVSARARHMALVLSPPDKPIPDAENHELNEFSLGTGDDGRSHGTLDLDNLLGEKLRVALDPLSKPVPEPDGSPDRRSNAQVRADALEQLLDSYLDQEDRPTRGGAKPHVVMTLSPEGLQAFQLRGLSGVTPPALAASFEWTGPASASTAQMVACDSVITKILVDNNMVGLDGHPWFINPDDAMQTPVRSHARRTMTSDLAAA